MRLSINVKLQLQTVGLVNQKIKAALGMFDMCLYIVQSPSLVFKWMNVNHLQFDHLQNIAELLS